MRILLTDRQKEIIRNMGARCDHENSIIFNDLEKGEINFSDISIICDIINSEFMMEGILPNFEPNAYGLELEGLLDVINKPRLAH
jgi:hypothetical protein